MTHTQPSRVGMRSILVQFAVFVSYAEIYNENVFDLLEAPPQRNARRVACKLGEENAEVYIKGNCKP